MKIKFFLCTLALSLATIACSERTDADEVGMSTNTYQKEKIKSQSQNMKKSSISFTFRSGRASKNCAGFGVCELSALGVTIVEGPIKITVTHQFGEGTPDWESGLKSSYLLTSANELDGMEDTTFYVDKDFYSADEEGTKYIFHKGEYRFDPTLGEFGGYAIDVNEL